MLWHDSDNHGKKKMQKNRKMGHSSIYTNSPVLTEVILHKGPKLRLPAGDLSNIVVAK